MSQEAAQSSFQGKIALKTRPVIWIIAALYLLETFFFFCNWWSMGITYPVHRIVIFSLSLSPLFAVLWVKLAGRILYAVGRWFKGGASYSDVVSSLVFSKTPFVLAAALWIFLLFLSPDTLFIQDSGIPYSIHVNFIYLTLAVWSFTLLVQSICKVQGFSRLRSFGACALSWLIGFALFFVIFNLYRYFLI